MRRVEVGVVRTVVRIERAIVQPRILVDKPAVFALDDVNRIRLIAVKAGIRRIPHGL